MAERQPSQWTEKFHDLVRALTGALLFGIPLIYTMEMWWLAVYLDFGKLMLLGVLGFGANLYLARLVGLREGASRVDTLIEALENMAVGIVAAAITLLVIDRIAWADPLSRTLSGVLLQSIPLSIGAAVTHTTRRTAQPAQHPRRADRGSVLFDQVGVTIAGALFFSFAIAPVDEVPKLEAQLDYWHIFGLIGFSLLVTYIIVYRSGLAPRWGGGTGGESAVPGPLIDTLMSYTISLLVALTTLYLFDQITIHTPLVHAISQVVVLGLPATVGGAAGRHVI